MNFLNRTLIVIPFLFLLIGIFSFLLYLNITKKVSAGSNEEIGVLTFKVKTIQRKYDGEVVWESIPTSTKILNRDTIRTENLADAVLTLEDGTEIQIGENSMIVVDFSDKNYNLNFAYGTVGAKKTSMGGDSSISIQAGDSVIQVGSGELSMNKTGEKLDVNVASGSSKITVDGKESELSQNQSAMVSEKGGLDIKKQNFNLLEPKDRTIIFTEESSDNISFSWSNNSDRIKNLRIAIATDVGFRRTVIERKVAGKSFQSKLSPNNYYWKLKYIDETGKETETSLSRFNLLRKESIRLFTPTNNQSIAQNENSKRPISFSWSKIEIASSYRVEVSSTKDFDNILLSKETRSNSLGTNELNPGDYYYRVVGKSNISSEPDIVSPVRKFSILTQKEILPPVLLSPISKKTYLLETTKDSGILFSWKDSVDFNRYRIQISNSSDFTTSVVDETFSKNYYRWEKNLQTGSYYWKVTGVSISGEFYPSTVGNFILSEEVNPELVRPVQDSIFEYPKNGEVSFAWKKLPSSGSIKILISTDKNFTKPIIEETGGQTGTKIKLSNSGRYYWKIIWIGKSGTSESKIFNFSMKSAIDPPKISFPRSGSTVDMTKRNDLMVQWDAVGNADLYRIRILDITGLRERVIVDTRTKSNIYKLTDLTKLNQGKFRVEVQSLKKNPNGNFDESQFEKQDFFITLNSGITTKILTPEKIYVE